MISISQASDEPKAGGGRVGLFMYAPHELRPVVAVWWAGVRAHLAAAGASAPAALEWPVEPYAHWTRPDLVLSQTCGYPLTHALAGRVAYVATPHYDAPGCTGAFYSSLIVAREGEAPARAGEAPAGAGKAAGVLAFEGRRLALNSLDSQSGRHALHAAVAQALKEAGRATPRAPFFADALLTGGHRESLAAVREGRADLCALDAVTAALIGDVAPQEWAGLAAIGRTPSAPGLPLITAAGRADAAGLAAMRRGLVAAMADPALAAARRALRIAGVEVLEATAYDAIVRMEEAAAHSLPERLFHPRQ